MEKNQLYFEIESLIVELEVLIKSLANSREYIAEEDFQRAQFKLSEIEIELQSVAGRVAFIKSNF